MCSSSTSRIWSTKRNGSRWGSSARIPALSSVSPTVHASVHVDDAARDVAAGPGEEGHDLGHLFGPAHAPERDLVEDPAFHLVGQAGGHLGVDEARRYRVHQDLAAP